MGCISCICPQKFAHWNTVCMKETVKTSKMHMEEFATGFFFKKMQIQETELLLQKHFTLPSSGIITLNVI
uniref:Uncharacterized protein n=1 Tax=Anguilla anguilla TaxID=7936 RepID=A0A0E9Y004_ANGAN